ncbi:hypothetical protein ACVW0K_007420 [Streptomyces filamentosus]
MSARVTLGKFPTGRPGNWLFGRWWWQVRIPGKGITTGPARTETVAQARAARAARRLAAQPDTTTYSIPASKEQPQ